MVHTRTELKSIKLSSPEEFVDILNVWEEIYNSNPALTPFQSHEWTYTWWKYFGEGELNIILVNDLTTPVAIAPLYVSKREGRRILKFIGTGNTDYLSCIIRPGYEKDSLTIINEYILNKIEWDEVYFEGIPVNYGLSWPGYKVCESSIINPQIIIKSGFEEYWSGLNKKFTSSLNRSLNKLKQNGPVELVIPPQELIKESLTGIFYLHRKSWQIRNSPGLFNSNNIREFLFEAVSKLTLKNSIQVFELHLYNIVAASILTFRRNDKTYYYTGGFDPMYKSYSPGSILLWQIIRYCFNNKIEVFDFLKGAEEYKYKWGAVDRLSASTLVRNNLFSENN